MKVAIVAGFMTVSWLLCPGESRCQDLRGVMITATVGVSTPASGNAFADAFHRGAAASVGTWYGSATRWRPWFEFELHEFTYDRRRFFDGLGIPDVDLATQLETGTVLWSAMIGMDFVPWLSGVIRPYLRGGLGFAHRDDGATPILVFQYCGFRPGSTSAAADMGDYPAHCTQAWNEVGSDFDALGVQFGIGTTVQLWEHLSGFFDVRLSQAFVSGAPRLVPVRVGVVAHR